MNVSRTLRATTAAGRGSARRWRYISAAWPQTGTVMASRRAASTSVGIARTRLRTVAPPNEGSKGSALAAAAAATLAAASAAAAALNSFGGGSTSVAGCSSADGVDDPYEPGQAVGVGIKAEMWKTKHPNLTILETIEDSPVLGLMSVVRNVETDGGAFLSAANRLMRQLLDFADMGFPNDDEAVFATPARVMMAGVLPEDDVNVCAISLYLENEPCGVFDMELDAAFPSFERGSLRVRGLTRGSSRELPRDMQGKQILLLAPVVGYAQPVLAALERLEQAGVEDENVTLVSVVISKDALETLTEEVEDMRVVCSAMDGETRGSDHQVVPGVGDFSRRYFEAKAIVEAEAAARAAERSAESSSNGKRRWWRLW
ncbi:unnamed protein product [Ectocarpus sp. 12 AP-2014]